MKRNKKREKCKCFCKLQLVVLSSGWRNSNPSLFLLSICPHCRLAQEAARLKEESQQLKIFSIAYRAALTSAEKAHTTQQKWEHYLKCSKVPLPSSEADINRYISAAKERGRSESMQKTMEFAAEIDSVSEFVIDVDVKFGVDSRKGGTWIRIVDKDSKFITRKKKRRIFI